ncbi:uncharacterized protein LOC116295841 [Actinia tenebrosa]|uniref:Uncharacterized protein LOC116295841 n=1 Tax=Actinia tenebrosa TaxID=6105 RepID=A0A6P8I4E2_ACTTE|nr:uncharacterized protein LOC116295841 [Actinia tenebrosa]
MGILIALGWLSIFVVHSVSSSQDETIHHGIPYDATGSQEELQTDNPKESGLNTYNVKEVAKKNPKKLAHPCYAPSHMYGPTPESILINGQRFLLNTARCKSRTIFACLDNVATSLGRCQVIVKTFRGFSYTSGCQCSG